MFYSPFIVSVPLLLIIGFFLMLSFGQFNSRLLLFHVNFLLSFVIWYCANYRGVFIPLQWEQMLVLMPLRDSFVDDCCSCLHAVEGSRFWFKFLGSILMSCLHELQISIPFWCFFIDFLHLNMFFEHPSETHNRAVLLGLLVLS